MRDIFIYKILKIKKLTFFLLSTIFYLSDVNGQCTSLFSFGANFETVNFYNQSTVSNAHFFWNFGDGTGSNLKNPIHKYSETGNYMVTLFARDTVSSCSAFYDFWINVTKNSLDSCQPISLIDSIMLYNNSYYLQLSDNSINCNNYSLLLDGGSSQNFLYSWWCNLPSPHARYLSRIRYRKYDPIVNHVVDKRMVYKSLPFNYSSAKNYDSCSANFEFKVVSQDANGQRILYTAMNRTATSYSWRIVGFGNPILSSNDTISQYYPLNPDGFWAVFLKTTGSTGCKDSLCQTIRIQDKMNTITGIIENNEQRVIVNVHPNPAHNSLFIDSKLEIRKVIVTDALGQEVLMFNTIEHSKELDIANLQPGIYFLRTENTDWHEVFKFVKE
ncbi:MAG: T9SS type A sorting domain-containing protein [Bacteroidia bacterium]|nr:T9SS type A sorting domain-containing protein [Bacteroidia bacterium]